MGEFHEPKPRISPVSIPTETEAELLTKTTLSVGVEPSNLFRTLVRHPELMKRTNVYAGLFLTKGVLEPRDRELAILRVAFKTECVYEYGQHVPLGLAAGLAREEIENIGRSPVDNLWNERDACKLRFADALIDGFEIPVDIWNPIEGILNSEQIMELIMLVGFYRSLAGLMNSVGIQPDLGMPTEFPRH